MSFDFASLKHVSKEMVDSTLLEAKRVWSDPETDRSEPVLITATEQYAGVGRDGRRWKSPKGGLWMTLIWPANKEIDYYQPVPLIAGLCTCYALEELYQLSPKIKWPNDILFDNKKLAGILCKAHLVPEPHAVFIGIGLNGNFGSSQLGKDIRIPAITLEEITKVNCKLETLCETIVRNLITTITLFEEKGMETHQRPIEKRMAWIDEKIFYRDVTEKLCEGIQRGIDENGQLLVEVNGNTVSLLSGEIHQVQPGENESES